MRQVSVPLAGLALLAVLAGCGGTPAATSTGPSTAPTSLAPTPDTTAASTGAPVATAVAVVRSGGMAPQTRSLRVDPDGGWEYSAGSQPVRHGRLTPAQRDRLSVLAEALAGAGAGPSAGPCADGYRYTVTAGTVTLRATDCDLAAHPALAALLEFVAAATPM